MPYNYNQYNRPKKKQQRADHAPGHRAQYEKNKKKILATQDTCGICGRPVDKTLHYPDPQSATIDHIIPIAKGGHPSDISNLQLAHFSCNRAKSDKVYKELLSNSNIKTIEDIAKPPEGLPLSIDWKQLRTEQGNQEELERQRKEINSHGKILTARGIIDM